MAQLLHSAEHEITSLALSKDFVWYTTTDNKLWFYHTESKFSEDASYQKSFDVVRDYFGKLIYIANNKIVDILPSFSRERIPWKELFREEFDLIALTGKRRNFYKAITAQGDLIQDAFSSDCFQSLVSEPTFMSVGKKDRVYICEKGSNRIKIIKHLESPEEFISKKFPKSKDVVLPRHVLLFWYEFKNPKFIKEFTSKILLVIDDFGLHEINIRYHTVKTLAKGNFQAVDVDNETIFLACKRNIFALQRPGTWYMEKLMWAGYLKNDPEKCLFARMPIEIFMYILSFITTY